MARIFLQVPVRGQTIRRVMIQRETMSQQVAEIEADQGFIHCMPQLLDRIQDFSEGE